MAENGSVESCEIQADEGKQDSYKDTIADDETCGCDVGFGRSKRISSKRLQFFATPAWALAFLSISSMMQLLVINGIMSVVISTLEKRFELHSTETGVMSSFHGIASFIVMMFLAFANEKMHKTKWLSFGTVLCGLGAFAIALPHFIAPTYSFVEVQEQNYCGNVTLKECGGNSGVRDYRYAFIVGVALMGAGSCFLHTFGVTYLDENVSKENSAFFTSVYFAIGALGPAFGFYLGGAALNLYTYTTMNTDELTIDSSSDLWVGAWWLGFLVTAIVLLFVAIPIAMLPRHLPGTAKHRANRGDEVQKVKSEKQRQENSVKVNFGDLLTLLQNKPYVFVTLGSAVNFAFILGFNTFGVKYVEVVFGVSPFKASVLYGTGGIIAGFVGQICGGYFIKRMALTMRGIIIFMIVCGVFSAVSSLTFFVHCEDIDIAGGTVPYPNTTFVQSQFSECNSDCGCSTDLYEPVCNNEVTYFSPCFAGCTEKLNETTYGSCSCVANFSSSPEEALVSSEWCSRNPCNMVWVFIAVLVLCLATSFLSVPSAYQVSLRCVPFERRMMALSVQRMTVLVVGSIPGRLITGAVMDQSCVSWSTECGEQGSCRAYRRWDVAKNNTIVFIAQTVVCAILYILVYVTYDPVGTEDDKTKKEAKTKDAEPEHIHIVKMKPGEKRAEKDAEALL